MPLVKQYGFRVIPMNMSHEKSPSQIPIKVQVRPTMGHEAETSLDGQIFQVSLPLMSLLS